MNTAKFAFISFMFFSLVFIASCTKTPTTTSQLTPAKPNIFTVGNDTVTVEEFLYVYDKNNNKSENAYSEASLNEYLNLFVNYKLIVNEAKAQKMDTIPSLKAEYENSRKQLAQPYLSEKKVTDALVAEAHKRMQEEVNVSHILVNCALDAEPKDTLSAYNKASEYMKKAKAGEDFAQLAKQFSDDKSAEFNGGNLGYFTAFDMVYPFESAAYGMQPQDVSGPIRSKFGYHILKMHDRRAARGKVRVSHIHVRAPAGIAEQDSVAAFRKIEEIFRRLQKGENWEELCIQYSEDIDSRDRGGELRPFGSGTAVPSFEEAAFALGSVGQYSQPVHTPYGWHIIKLLERIGIESFSQAEQSLRTRINRDSRSEVSKTFLLERLKKENGYKENKPMLDYVRSLADTSIFEGQITYKSDDKNLKNPVFSLQNANYPVEEFLQYIQGKKRFKKDISPSHYITLLFNTFVEDRILKYEEENLALKYKEYRLLLNEYKEGMMLFAIKDTYVWNKGSQDTVGLKNFFEANKTKYRWDKRANVILLESASEKALQQAISLINEPRFPINEPKIQDVEFESNSSKLKPQDSLRLRSHVRSIYNSNGLKLDIIGRMTAIEKNPKGRSLAMDRAMEIYNVLIHYGAQAEKLNPIVEIKDKKGKALYAKVPSVGFVPFTVLRKGIETIVNANDPLAIKITEGKFQQKDLPLLSRINFEVGQSNFVENGKFYHIRITEIEESREKTLEESRGQVISDYQQKLEEDWVAELKLKFPVEINYDEFNKIIKN